MANDDMTDNTEQARMSWGEFFGKEPPATTYEGATEQMARASKKIDAVERFGVDVKVEMKTRDVFIEPKWGNTWKDVASRAFDSQKASGVAAFNDSIDDRCENMDTWKECALDVLGYTKFS